MKTLLIKLHNAWELVERQVLNRLAPVADLAARLYVAQVFFASGWNKIQDWDSTLYLFREEYQVPLLPPDVAAAMGTSALPAGRQQGAAADRRPSADRPLLAVAGNRDSSLETAVDRFEMAVDEQAPV